MISKPNSDDYAAYATGYVNKVPDGADVLQVLLDNQIKTYNLFHNMTDAQAMHAYAEGKWTLKEVLGHMIDTERVFSFRAFVFSREDISLPGFDQETYVFSTDFNSRTIQSLADEFKAVREATLFLYRSFSAEQLKRSGVASGALVKVGALVYITAGHEIYHLDIIKERYL
ncbi:MULTISPECIES: DinB family protein [unclassified Mucilaginibacter]|uniref:DinB family protein n=1 Tax=unclassified Mucilaginibacter TaxID=2617802 RepID=UPI002AC8D3BF|nr:MULTISPECIES: DinB family protein [unclassified Mucilaginibacter]MEB0263781.1 DinB family protein [Mucilaginibacter sp. 10I4]MEB0280234.1 DinB family protein [Mucilaginibacter sp. 10B2]MEB0301143.1 DinB family protein [Mucilaginibacter sp. 5C4]WPX24357.1 DinB family protein [Mucilaginibacter sp. 5C4]